jgi:peptidoglycan L-alanyl-D-glutamate endopeptidase CwlK
MQGVHPLLVKVISRAAELIDGSDGLGFIVTEGRRSAARQAELVKAGASRTLNSRHLTGHAVDLAATVSGEVRWDWPLYARLAEIVRRAAEDCDVAITWGGDWVRLKDGPHFEIDPGRYP